VSTELVESAYPRNPEPELVTIAAAIADEHRQVEECLYAGLSGALIHAIEAGRKLNYAKSFMRHGEWTPWVEQNVGIANNTARKYRQLARAADSGQLEVDGAFANLTITRALEQLAAGSSASGSDGRSSPRRARSSPNRDPIRRLLAYSEPFGLEDDLDVKDLEAELCNALIDRYPTHAAEWAQWHRDRFESAFELLEAAG
jgi:hypothetical protein